MSARQQEARILTDLSSEFLTCEDTRSFATTSRLSFTTVSCSRSFSSLWSSCTPQKKKGVRVRESEQQAEREQRSCFDGRYKFAETNYHFFHFDRGWSPHM